LGLPDNYAQPLPALLSLGFEADQEYLRAGGPRLAAGVDLAEERLRERAAERGLSLTAYRRGLQRLYRERFHHSTGGDGTARPALDVPAEIDPPLGPPPGSGRAPE
jgi:hypothetical protein